MPTALQPDDPITSIEIILHTAMHDDASTNDDIFVALFAEDLWIEIDSDDDDFEAGAIGTYALPNWYFGGRIVNDIRRICFRLEDNYGTAWGFGWVALKVNGRFLFEPPGGMLPTETVRVWLNDPDTWCNRNLLKLCGCAAFRWGECVHSWHVNMQIAARLYRFSLDRHLGKQRAGPTRCRRGTADCSAADQRWCVSVWPADADRQAG